MSNNISRKNVEDIFALTSLQQGMLFYYLNDSGSCEYLEQLSLGLKGRICAETIKKAWNYVVQCNEMLRAVYRWDKLEAPVQIIQRDYEVPVRYFDIKEKNEQERELLTKEIREKDREAGIDISTEPFRITVVKLSEDEAEMIITNHHILYDGWSSGIIIKEFIEAYENILDGKALVKRVKPRFKEYVKWQQRQNKEEQLEYWKGYLEGYVEKAVIAGYRSGEEKKGKTVVYREEIEQELKSAIGKVCRKEEVTIATVINAAWGILLQRYNNTGDAVFGTTVSGRAANLEGIEETVGLYINTLPIRVKTEGKESIAEVLRQVERDTREREAYESLALVEIQGAVGAGGGESLFDTLVVIENYPIDKRLINREGKVEIEIGEVNEVTNYDITIGVMLNDKVGLSISYKEGKYEAEGIRKLTGHLKNILWEISENSRKPVEEIEMVSKAEKQQLLYEFNDTYAEYPKDKTIHELFEKQVARTPDNIAVVYEDRQLTYRELNEKANQLARVLREKGVVPDSIVGIMVERSLEMIIGIMGILKAGGAYLPIDPEYPAERIEYLLEDSGSSILLTQKHLRDKCGHNGWTIELDDERIYQGDWNNLENINRPNDLAYVIYTSGSTGKPKGVMVEHKSAINILSALQKEYSVLKTDSYLLKTAYTFDVSVAELFGWFFGEGKLVILEAGAEKEPLKILKSIKNNNITHINFVPSMLNIFIDVAREVNLDTVYKLKYVFAAGEAISKDLTNKFHTFMKKVKLENIYGPTEATVYATKYGLLNLEERINIPIGKPLQNTRIYIIDKRGGLQPIGAAGELCIAGDGLARGYLNKPELTAEKFVGNPFETGTSMYKTGDLARWLPDGNIEFLGRIDHQVKIRGFRIELGEIENSLFKHEDIKEAVVIAKEEENKNKYLCAYIVGERKLKVGELREYLGKELADYMIPSYFIQIDKMPLNHSGKIDRKALPEPDGSIEIGEEYEAPRNEIEEKLVCIWEKVLGADRIGINDNFFELGGHSLKATSMVSKIHKELNIEMPLSQIFRTPRIKGLAEYIKGREESIYASIEPIEKKEHYELSSAQKRLYTLQQFDRKSTGYNMPGVMEIEGKLDVERLEAVFGKLIERHEALRTSFELIGEEVVQKIHKEAELEIEHKEAREEDVEEILRSFIRPFDLSKAPLLRVGLVKLHPEKHILMFDMHHIISDGTSMGILVKEFMGLYEGKALPESRLQYKDYVAWQNSVLSSETMKKQEEHWLKTFKEEIPVLSLPTDYQRPAIQSFEGDSIHFELDGEITKGLRKIAKETGATMYMVLLSGFNILLSKYSGQEDIVIGSPIAGRHHADLENVIGMFVNTLAMRNYPEGSKTIKEFIEEVKANALRAYENQNYQFEELVEKLDIRRDMSRNPVFDVMFAMQNMDIEEIVIEGISIKSYGMENGVSKFDITLTAEEAEEKIGLSIEYCSRLFNKETIERMAGYLKNILREIEYNINKRICEIEILGEEERHKLLYEFNNTYAEYLRDKTIHELFEEQVEKTPDNIAVVYENRQLTYRELNEKSNQLARALREKGVVPDSIVGIMIERSIEMIVGIMGILKAGGAYLPIDPEYPKDRIGYMLEDSMAYILITRKLYIGNIADTISTIIDIEDISVISGMAEQNINAKYDKNRKMYLIYTSGSTGNPKGAAVRADSFMNLTNWFTREFNISESDNVLLIAPVGFDLAQKNLYAALVKGGRLCILPERTYNYTSVLKIIHKERITIINCTPSAFQLIIDAATDCHELEYLRWVFLGGEPINTANLVKWVKSQYYKAEIVNTYGPTECTDIATYYKISKQEIENMVVIPIGKPIDNVKLYIVDKNNNLLPIGHQGELCIGGVSLGTGYLNRPELTVEKFVENPFEPGKRMYKTGDLTRWLPDGNIEFLGRIDHQVKIRGFRIELGEVESQLLKHEAVKEAVVAAKGDQGGNKYLCAYITAEKELTIIELRGYLRQELPDYMVPSYFVQLDKMPLTPNGKIDRKALPEPDGIIETGAEYEAPRSEMEEKLVSIWQEVLGAEKIGINDNFFDLGGHSLKATSMVSKIHKELNVEVPLREVFKTPTIKGLSEYMKGHGENIYAAIEPVEEKEHYGLSSAQKRLYTLQQLDLKSTGYNISGVREIQGKLDVGRLEAAFEKLIERHEALRTSFELMGEEIVQKIHKEAEFEIEYKEAREEDIQEIARSFIRAFDLSKAPLLRVGLIKLYPEKHILMFDMHHIISDGTSIGILVDELVKLYEGKKLPNLRLQYKDYAAWQNKMINSGVMKNQAEYWLKAFEGGIPALNLPIDYQRPAIQSFEGDTTNFELNEEITKELRNIAKETGSTIYMVLLAGFNVLLSKYSGQEDIVVGSPIAGRPHADLKNIMGMFVNTLAIRNYPSGEKTVREFIEEVKENALRAYENQDYQFEELVDRLNITRDMSRNPLFDVLFVLQNLDTKKLSIENLKFRDYETENKTAKFDIIITAVEAGKIIKINIQYCTKLFEKASIERMKCHLIRVMKELTKGACKQLKEIEIITEEEKKQILEDFNSTYTEYPKNKTIQELFEEQVEKTPDNIAVIYENQQLTYRELNRRANQLARVLRKKGVVPDSIVGIKVDRSLEMIVGIMGILKAGGAYLPIDPDYPEDRIKFILEDSGAKLLISQTYQIREVYKGSEIININDKETYALDSSNLEILNRPTNLAYIIYTSGSTGKPKGVMISNYSVINFINSQKKEFGIDENERILQFSTISFDASVEQIFVSLLSGAVLILVSKQRLLDITEFQSYIEEKRVTHLHAVPAFLENIRWRDSYKLKRVLAGGDVCPMELANRWNIHCDFYNKYGPTETTVTSIELLVKKGFGKVLIGKPISNTRIYITDKNNKLCPIGVRGELCIAGDGLAIGYLNRPELTAEKFVENPFEPGKRMYRTGDLARWLSDGNIEFLGRIDHQVKIRGFRIELREIESRLLKHEAIKEAVVAAKEDQSGNKYICAYIKADKELTVSELRGYMGQELPDYMVPSYFVQLDKMPLTPNGKIDRKALPEPNVSMMAGTEYEAPRNDIEEKLVKIWQEVLRIEKIGINDNFFDLGGHSLKATSMVSKIHKELNVEVPLREVFKRPTVKELAEFIKGQKENIYSSIVRVEKRSYYEMSSAQKRLYTLQQFDLENTSYNMPGILEMEGKLDAERLNNVFKRLIKRHEALRTSFELIREEIVQKIQEEAELEIEYKEAVEEEIEEILRSFVRPFDLSKAPLLRVGLVKLYLEKYILMFDMHHIISDGTSMGILTDEFVKLYEGQELSPLRLQYKDYAAWQNSMLSSEIIKKQERYWLKTFKEEIPVLSLPTNYQRPAIQIFEGDRVYFELDEEIARGLRKTAKETGATMYMVLLAGFNILLSKYSGQEDIAIGSPIAGRPHADLDNIIGMFVNTLAMRNYPKGRKTIIEFIEEVKINALNAYENQDYQFEELVERLNIRRDMSRNPVFDVMFAMQNMDMGEMAIEGISIKPYRMENHVSKFDITIEVVEKGEKLGITIEYYSRLFNKDTIERMAGHFKNVLRDIAQNTGKRISKIDMLGEEEKHRLLYEFNDTYAEYPRGKTIHELFEDQVEKKPDNIAVVYEDKQLTYRELNEKANQLARILRENGIVPDSIVGIMVERSLEMIVGIMGILKAGGAYLPIDPEYPTERIRYMLEDSGTGILLTQKQLIGKAIFDGEVIELDDELLYAGDSSNLVVVNRTDNLAYVIYTSGSTGKPKGVMLEHRSINNFIHGIGKKIEFKKGKTILALTTIAFDIFVLETLVPLSYGLKIVVANENQQKDPGLLNRIIVEQGIDMLQMTSSRLQLLLAADSNMVCFQRVKEIMVGGEAFQKALLQKLQKSENIKIYNLYGPTEATVWSAVRELSKEAEVNIGRPIANTQIYIIDEQNSLQPIGVAGELCIGGDGLARGYLNRLELTSEKFVENPFVSGARMYKTGDLAKWLPDGNIEFLGRIDQQVKIRGFRIELGEIESQLLKQPGIKEAIVVAKEDENSSKYICAYIVGEEELVLSELREHLGKELPDYMIPSYFVQLESIPLTPNGKVNRKALPEPNGSMIAGAEYEAPRNGIEEKLVSIWQEVLGADRIGINDNFFELGGHSLKGMMIINRIHEKLNIKITLQGLFRLPTVAALYEHIKNSAATNYSNIKKLPVKNYYELSYAQKRLWTIKQLEPESAAYNISGKLKLHEKVDFQIVKKVFDTLIDRHEAFRTCFGLVGGEPMQIIESEIHFIMGRIDFSALDEVDRDKSSEQLYREESEKVFDLNTTPLFRAILVKLKEYEYDLIFSMHHIISDGWSIEIMKNEFSALYNAYKENNEIGLPDLLIGYKDFAAWQNELLSDEVQIINAKEYWQKQLSKELMPLNLPSNRAYNKLSNKESAAYRFIIYENTKVRLKEISKDFHVSLFTILLSAFSYYLSDLTGQKDILVGIPGSGRNHEELKGVIGYFVNTIVLINEINAEERFTDLLGKINENILKALEYQNYPLELVADTLNIAYPPISVFFNMLNIEDRSLINIEVKEPHHIEKVQDAKFDIACYIIEYANGIEISCNYIKRLFEPDIIENMMKKYAEVVEHISENPNLILKECSKAVRAKKEEGYVKPTCIEMPLPKQSYESPIIRMFKEQLKLNPNNIAVKTKEKELTYSMLGKYTGVICQEILKQYEIIDNDNEHVIALLFEHSADMVIATIGALISGKIYVPFDISYPEKRLLYMLENSEAQCIVTNSKNIVLAQKLASNISREIRILNIDSIDYSQNVGDIKNKVLMHKNQIAYLLYTSGSTGKPKGVIQTHENIAHFIEAYIERLSITVSDKMTLFSAFSHDAAVMDIYGGLLSGATLYPLNIREQADMREFAGWIENEGITIWHSVPTLYRYFVNTLTGEEEFSKLRLVVLGGESVLKYDVMKFKEIFKYTTLVNLYGQSESSYNSSYFINRNTDNDRIILGEPVKETKILVVDEDGEELGSLSTGEIVIASRYVALGYWKNHKKTSEVFDFSSKYGRIYRTGDLGRILRDDCIEFMGRKDSQIKIRGYRVELEEIESLLLKHKNVKEAAVTLKELENDEKYICAYFAADHKVESSELRDYLSEELPEYMIPSYFIRVDKMPLTISGKIDRKVLPEPSEIISSNTDYEAPGNEVEEKLLFIWQEILKADKIGINDDFLELGGNSLKAISMAARIQKEFMIEIPLRVIIKDSTIKRLGRYIEEASCINKCDIKSFSNKKYYPATWNQKRMYILHQMESSETIYYNYPVIINIKGILKTDKLVRVLKELITKYETITASFRLIDEEVVQLINEDIELNISYMEIEESMQGELIKRFIKPFDLSCAPLFRVGLIKIAEDRYTLIIDMHKIISSIMTTDDLNNKEQKMWIDEFISLIQDEYITEFEIQDYKH